MTKTRGFAICLGLAVAAHSSRVLAQTMDEARTACAADVKKLCSRVQPGGGRIIACLKEHQDAVSDGCKKAARGALQAPAEASPPAERSGPAPEPSDPTPEPKSRDASGGGERYYRMKQVKLVDQAAGGGRTAYTLMIPTRWKFESAVNVNVAEGGCFADWFSAFGDANSEDGAFELQLGPVRTWQYIDNPAAQREMQQVNQRRQRAGLKPCPVRAPIHAADYLRQDLLSKYRKGQRVISVEPFPELDNLARRQLALLPGTPGIRTEAARARVAVDHEGKSFEEWWATVIVVRAIATGSGTAYDWHAIDSLVFRAPKGKLDANDKLFKLMASTIRPDPGWLAFSNGVIATFYRKQQEEEAKQSAIIRAFQAQVVETLDGVVANQQRGSYESAAGADRLIRGVQVFRDPGSGATFELSNHYDHAWLNGANEYLMSDDPGFTPNGNVPGNWTQLQLVK